MVKKTFQLILNKKTTNLGEAGDIINVKLGYARNYLLPKKIAEPLTLGKLNYIKKIKEEKIKKQEEKITAYNEVKIQLDKINKFSLKRKIGENNTIFGSVNEKDIITLVYNQVGFTLDKNQINIPEIKSTGVYKIEIIFMKNITSIIQLHLLPEIIS